MTCGRERKNGVLKLGHSLARRCFALVLWAWVFYLPWVAFLPGEDGGGGVSGRLEQGLRGRKHARGEG